MTIEIQKGEAMNLKTYNKWLESRHSAKSPYLRRGQLMFNELCVLAPEIAEEIRGTDHDAFYDDKKMVNMIYYVDKRHRDYQIELAEQVATKAHEGQTRWDGTPYINHPARVAKWLKNQGYSRFDQIVGWLHDTVEDTCLLYEEIEDKFGLEVKKAVQCLTHDDGSYADYIMRVRTNSTALVVKIADLNDNLSDLLPKNKERIDKYELALAILEEANE